MLPVSVNNIGTYCCTCTRSIEEDSSNQQVHTAVQQYIQYTILCIHVASNFVLFAESGDKTCCTKRFAEFNGNINCESYCSLEQLVALLCAAHKGKSASGTYHPKTEGYTRRYLYRPLDLLYCEGST